LLDFRAISGHWFPVNGQNFLLFREVHVASPITDMKNIYLKIYRWPFLRRLTLTIALSTIAFECVGKDIYFASNLRMDGMYVIDGLDGIQVSVPLNEALLIDKLDLLKTYHVNPMKAYTAKKSY
jgi:hypothetical protein